MQDLNHLLGHQILSAEDGSVPMLFSREDQLYPLRLSVFEQRCVFHDAAYWKAQLVADNTLNPGAPLFLWDRSALTHSTACTRRLEWAMGCHVGALPRTDKWASAFHHMLVPDGVWILVLVVLLKKVSTAWRSFLSSILSNQ